MARLGVMSKVSEPLKALVPSHKDEQFRLSASKVVGATLSKLSVLVLNGKLTFDEPFFDVVIVDESSMATIPLTLAGVLLGKAFILVGDHKQLPPITKSRMPPSCSCKGSCGVKCESLFRLLIELYPQNAVMLETQFRSHPAIIEFSSRHFYGNRIKSGESCLEKKLVPKHLLVEQIKGIVDGSPLCYIDMHYDDMPYENVIEWFPSKRDEGSKHVQPSCLNRYEATIALKVRHDLIKAGIHPDNIWFITPYRLQREILKKAVRKIYGNLSSNDYFDETHIASTVDSIQGKENEIVIYNLTWVPSEEKENVSRALTDFRRLNVAMTRAKKKLIIIGDLSKLSGQYPYGDLESYLRNNAKVIPAPLIKDMDDFLTIIDGCFSEKQKIINEELACKVKVAKFHLRQQLPLSQGLRRYVVRDEKGFDIFKKSGEWKT
jgi:DNA replication ATP-dependent helicase Dna2